MSKKSKRFQPASKDAKSAPPNIPLGRADTPGGRHTPVVSAVRKCVQQLRLESRRAAREAGLKQADGAEAV